MRKLPVLVALITSTMLAPATVALGREGGEPERDLNPMLEVCKEAGSASVTGTFTFSVTINSSEVGPAVVAVGECQLVLLSSTNTSSTVVPHTLLVTVTEQPSAYVVDQVRTDPVGRLTGSNLPARTATVSAPPGITTVYFRNRVPGPSHPGTSSSAVLIGAPVHLVDSGPVLNPFDAVARRMSAAGPEDETSTADGATGEESIVGHDDLPFLTVARAEVSTDRLIIGHDDQPFLTVARAEVSTDRLIVGHDDQPFLTVARAEVSTDRLIVGHEDVPYVVASAGPSRARLIIGHEDVPFVVTTGGLAADKIIVGHEDLPLLVTSTGSDDDRVGAVARSIVVDDDGGVGVQRAGAHVIGDEAHAAATSIVVDDGVVSIQRAHARTGGSGTHGSASSIVVEGDQVIVDSVRL